MKTSVADQLPADKLARGMAISFAPPREELLLSPRSIRLSSRIRLLN